VSAHSEHDNDDQQVDKEANRSKNQPDPGQQFSGAIHLAARHFGQISDSLNQSGEPEYAEEESEDSEDQNQRAMVPSP